MMQNVSMILRAQVIELQKPKKIIFSIMAEIFKWL